MPTEIQQFDLKGIRCPLPIVHLNQLAKEVGHGQTIAVLSDDPAFEPDVQAWCRHTGHHLVAFEKNDGVLRAEIRFQA